jgi:hypothetical protein
MDPKPLLAAARALKSAAALVGRLDAARASEAGWPELSAGAKLLAGLVAKAGLADVEAALRAELASLEAALAPAREAYRAAFGRDLSAALAPLGLELAGQYPTFRVGVLTLEVDADRERATLSYGPDEIARERPVPAALAAAVAAFRRDVLEAPFDEAAFLRSLLSAWRRALRNAEKPATDPRVPVLDVLLEQNLVVQGEAFRADPSARTFRPLTRHAFSSALHRLRHGRALSIEGRRLVLHTAVYDDTRARRDYLWVPDDDRGNGTRVARLSFQEEAT